MADLGRFLIVLGLIAIAVGMLVSLGPRIPWLGRLPGDFFFKRGNFTFYFPLATSIVLSVILTVLIKLFRK